MTWWENEGGGENETDRERERAAKKPELYLLPFAITLPYFPSIKYKGVVWQNKSGHQIAVDRDCDEVD